MHLHGLLYVGVYVVLTVVKPLPGYAFQQGP